MRAQAPFAVATPVPNQIRCLRRNCDEPRKAIREHGPENANHAARQCQVVAHQWKVFRRPLKFIELKAQMPRQHRQQFPKQTVTRWAGQVQREVVGVKRAEVQPDAHATVSYTHLTLPTKRIV